MSSVHEEVNFFKTQPDTTLSQPTQPPNMLKWAQAYRRRGFYVFPVHNPIFDDAGNCTGCTCEEWKRTQPAYGPDFKCPQPGKCPRVKWSEKSTRDANQLGRWWGKKWRNVDVETGRTVWNYPNIGIDMGKSRALAFDRDLYKNTYAGAQLQATAPTVSSKTGGGGIHEWYQMPQGKAYGNATGDLPSGIDVRGAGGYIVAPPSLHKSGRRYEFIEGHSPADLDPQPLPQFLIDILEAAQTKSAARPVDFTAGSVEAPDLDSLRLYDDILELIHNGAPKGERSEADHRVVKALAKAGASDDEIRAVFVHYAIGEKYREKGSHGDQYLAHSIRKQRAWLEDHPPDPPTAIERLLQARAWARSSACLAYLRRHLFDSKGKPYRRVAELVPVLDGMLEMLLPRRTTRMVTTIREVADRCGVAKSTAQRRLARLVEAGLVTTQPDPYGTLIDLSSLVDLSGTISPNVESVPLRSTSGEDFFADHRTDDAFTSYPYAYAIKRRKVPTVLMQSLGASALLLWDALLDGGTVNDLAEVTGLTVPSVRATLKRFNQAGLLVIWQEGRAKWYELHPNAEERLDERREHMATAGIGQLRAARNASDIATFAQRKLQGRMPLEPREKARLKNRRDKADDKVAAYYDALLAMGIDPRAKVRERPPRHRNRIDYGEEWVFVDRPIYEQWQELLLAGVPASERYRMMGIAGYERAEIKKALHMAGKMGRGPRIFVGMGEARQEVAA